MTLPAPWELCPWLLPRPPLTPVLPAACEHLALGTSIPTQALTPDLMDEPGEGTACSQHAIIPPRSSPAQGVASKLPDHLQRLVLTGMRPDLAVCVRSTHPMEKTKLCLLPPPVVPLPPALAAAFCLSGQSALGSGPTEPYWTDSRSLSICSAQAPPRSASTSCAHMYHFYNALRWSSLVDPIKTRNVGTSPQAKESLC